MSDPRDLDTAEFEVPILSNATKFEPPISSRVRLEFGSATHKGLVRSKNEDSYLIYRVGRYWEKLTTTLNPDELPGRIEETGYTLAVADGMGGMAGGEVASSTALRLIANLVLRAARWAKKLDNPETRDSEIKEAMVRAETYFRTVDDWLVQYAEIYPALKGMGTTLTSAYVFGKDLFTLHVGDSRAYLLRKDDLSLLTRDQTVAQQLADRGVIKQDEVESHFLRHTLTSCLGGRGGEIDLEVRHYQLLDNDRLLLCTDGLTDMVPHTRISETLQLTLDAQQACDTLVATALEEGGRDNVTALVANYHCPENSSNPEPSNP